MLPSPYSLALVYFVTRPCSKNSLTSTQPSLNLHSSLQVDAISVCKIRCIDVALQRVHALRMEVGSYALMHDTGFELVRFLCYPLFDTRFLCCQLLYILLRYTTHPFIAINCSINCYDTRFHCYHLLYILLRYTTHPFVAINCSVDCCKQYPSKYQRVYCAQIYCY